MVTGLTGVNGVRAQSRAEKENCQDHGNASLCHAVEVHNKLCHVTLRIAQVRQKYREFT